jgi:hypothetical protein
MRILSFESIMNPRRPSRGAPRNILVGKNYVLWWDSDGCLWAWPNDQEWWNSRPLLFKDRLFLKELHSWGHLVQLRVCRGDPQKSCDAIVVAPQHGVFPLTFPWTDDEQNARRTAEVLYHAWETDVIIHHRNIIPLRGGAARLCSLGSRCFGIDAMGQLTALHRKARKADGAVAEPIPIEVPSGRRAIDFIYDDSEYYSKYVLFDDGSLGYLPRYSRQLSVDRVATGRGLDSPIAELVNYVRYETFSCILVRTQSDRWYVSSYNTRSRTVLWCDAASGESDASLVTFENTCGEAIRLLIHSDPIITRSNVVHVPTDYPLVDVCTSHVSNDICSVMDYTPTVAVVDALGFIYLFEIHYEWINFEEIRIKFRFIEPSPINPDHPVLLF